jgi:preprotein translocase subunit SecB
MADKATTTASQPKVNIAIHRIYSKNHQFVVQGLPPENNTGWNPTVNFQANPRFTKQNDGKFEVVIAVKLQATQNDKPVFEIYFEQAGLFTLTNASETQQDGILYGVCGNMLFPYAAVTFNQFLANAGLPPIYLAPMDFMALYQQHQLQEKGKKEKAAQETVVVLQ